MLKCVKVATAAMSSLQDRSKTTLEHDLTSCMVLHDLRSEWKMSRTLVVSATACAWWRRAVSTGPACLGSSMAQSGRASLFTRKFVKMSYLAEQK